MLVFPINRHEGRLIKVFQGSALKDIEKIEREEEERREKEAEALPNRDDHRSLHRSLFGVLWVTID